MLPERLGPETVAVAVLALADEADVAAECGFILYAAQVGAEFGVGIDAKRTVLEGGAEGEGELLFDRAGEGDGLDFVTELAAQLLGQLHAEAGGVHAATEQF